MKSKLPDCGTTIFTVMSAMAAECGALNLSQGFPDYDGPEVLREALARAVLEGNNQYPPMAGLPALREQISAKLFSYYNVHADAESEVTVTPGATEAIFCAITACVHPGDEVVVFDPCYDSYEPAVTLAGGITRHIPMSEPGFAIDWEQVEDSITGRTRVIIVNSPHNPTGSILRDGDLRALEALAVTHNLTVISDEVYEHLLFDGESHHSVLQYPGLRERSFAVFSFGKTYHVTGWKTGYCVASPQLSSELRKVHQYVTFVGVRPIQQALAEFMQAEADFPASLAGFYQAKRDLLCDLLAPSRFSLSPSAGTYFQLLEYSEISDAADTDMATQLTRERGIASIPVSVFCRQALTGRYLRLCFAKSESMLEQAAEVLCAI